MELKVAEFLASLLLPEVTGDIYVTLDQWDGYRAEREEILRTLREHDVKNFVTITGDLHTFVAGYLREDFSRPWSPPVGVCFLGGSVTSSNLQEVGEFGGITAPPPAIVNAVVYISNPHIAYFNSNEHGYNVITATPQFLTCEMKTVSTVREPTARLFTRRKFLVPRDRVEIRDVTFLSRGNLTEAEDVRRQYQEGRLDLLDRRIAR
jgi:alkaline phosphatase D